MEYIEIEGERVPIPPEVVSEGREAVAAYVAQLPKKRRASKQAGSTAEEE